MSLPQPVGSGEIPLTEAYSAAGGLYRKQIGSLKGVIRITDCSQEATQQRDNVTIVGCDTKPGPPEAA